MIFLMTPDLRQAILSFTEKTLDANKYIEEYISIRKINLPLRQI